MAWKEIPSRPFSSRIKNDFPTSTCPQVHPCNGICGFGPCNVPCCPEDDIYLRLISNGGSYINPI